MIVLVYGSDIVSNRVKQLLNSNDVEIITVTDKITRPKDLNLLRKLRNIDLAIVDINETGAEKACSYLGRVRQISLALLVDDLNTNWEQLISYPVSAYLPKDAEDSVLASDIKRVISRIRITSEISRTEREVTVKNLELVMG